MDERLLALGLILFVKLNEQMRIGSCISKLHSLRGELNSSHCIWSFAILLLFKFSNRLQVVRHLSSSIAPANKYEEYIIDKPLSC